MHCLIKSEFFLTIQPKLIPVHSWFVYSFFNKKKYQQFSQKFPPLSSSLLHGSPALTHNCSSSFIILPFQGPFSFLILSFFFLVVVIALLVMSFPQFVLNSWFLPEFQNSLLLIILNYFFLPKEFVFFLKILARILDFHC